MTKIVFQGREYLLRDEFWQEVKDAGFHPFTVEQKNGVLDILPIQWQEFAQRHTGRVASWVLSADKSVSVFRAALQPENQARLNRIFQESIRDGLAAVHDKFVARTKAQGKVRLPAEARFTVFIHDRAKDGSPQLHAHIAVDDRVKVTGQDKTVATHKADLYRLRNLFEATQAQSLTHALVREFGVAVQKNERGVRITEVPQALCQKASVRSEQIDDYLKKQQISNTPVARRYAALATRRANRHAFVGRDAFLRELQSSGFRSEQICQRVRLGESPQ